MNAVKDSKRVDQMFAMGTTTMVDPETKYRYSMIASCPKDGGDAHIARIERYGSSLSRVVFQCDSCFYQFEPSKDKIMVI